MSEWRGVRRAVSLGVLWVVACQPLPKALLVKTAPPVPSASRSASVDAVDAAAVALANAPLPEATRVSAHCFECADGRFTLSEGWRLQAAVKSKAVGKDLSLPGFDVAGWYPARVPSTVLAALVDNHVYPDPDLKDNLAAIPSAPFAGAYWYRNEFTLPADFTGQTAFLNFDGVNYRANVWLNGELIVSAKDLIGTFTSRELEVTSHLRAGKPNALAVEVFAPDLKRDLALSWLDWNATPPDRNMGIWRDVYLKHSGPVAVRGARVSSQVDLATLASADLTIKAELTNTTDHAVHTTLEGALQPSQAVSGQERVSLSQDVELAAHETKTVVFDAAHFANLAIKQPQLWWPAELGTPHLYDLTLRAQVGGSASDSAPLRFGIRSVSFELDPDGKRAYRINGKRVFIRGGGWASDLLLRNSDQRLETEFAFVKDLGLNNIRPEGKLESDDFYAKADAYGVLITPGWMCCDRWQASKSWSPAERAIGRASMATQARRLRSHPSVIDFLIGSDEAPSPEVEREFVGELQKADWPNPISNSASDRTSPLLGKSGRKMSGPYDWVAPVYWYEDKKYGGAFGFNSETCPGPAVPELETLRAWLSENDLENLWRKPRARQAHAGTAATRFDNLSVFNQALAARLGAPKSLADYVEKAQLMNYEAERAMFEAYGRESEHGASGIVQWLLNSAWPSLIWHLYAHDLSTAGGYFGAKKANEPLHLQYSYDDRSIVLRNRTAEAVSGLTASVAVYDIQAKARFAREFPVDAAPNSSSKLLALPELDGLSTTYFLSLKLRRGGEVISENFYWLSTKRELSDYKRTDWDYTPVTQFADFSQLSALPAATVSARISAREERAGRQVLRVALENTSPAIALLVRLELKRGAGGAQLLPVFWQDNYVSLLPGEKRELGVSFAAGALGDAAASVEVSGYNVAQTLASSL